MRLAAVLILTGCASGEIVVTPASVDFGEVDFNQARPDTGYDPRNVEISNAGGGAVQLAILGIDDDHILVGGQFADTDPPVLHSLPSGSSAVVTVGVWDYEAGEWGTEVTGAFRLSANELRDDVTVEWSFTPVRVIDE